MVKKSKEVRKPKEENCCDEASKFPYHGEEIRHINRAIGQLEGAKKMIEERRYCTEILALLSGIRSSIKSVESNILQTYLDSCVTKAFQANNEEDKKRKINELKGLFKRFE
jgi:DNA-binding FrmR family transcriptional regulator